jgi:vacuolar-type H+-ATPase subunit I/STV1
LKKAEKHSIELNEEKNELEDIILKQENKINDIAHKVSTIDKLLKEKNKEIKDNETNCLQLVKIIEEQKNVINKFNSDEKPDPKQQTSVTRLQNELKCIIS